MRRVRAVFLLPIKDNDGTDFEQPLEVVQQALLRVFGGYTNLGLVKGSWHMKGGEVCLDILLRYSVTLEEGRLDELRAILRAFKTCTTQEVVYLEVQKEVDVELL